jgi:hypothetical protein
MVLPGSFARLCFLQYQFCCRLGLLSVSVSPKAKFSCSTFFFTQFSMPRLHLAAGPRFATRVMQIFSISVVAQPSWSLSCAHSSILIFPIVCGFLQVVAGLVLEPQD